ncbi:MAG: tRNA-dihydrouridine synthase [Nanoarchaeota archaeon]|nr:tRNA-dihydrouridine synthase [Nanoarchaeota archaeon]
MLKIDSLKLSNPFILAPLHGVNCLAFRLLCKDFGASLVSAPMIHIKRIINKKSLPIEISNKEKPLSIQLVGNDVKEFRKAAKIIEPYADIIDINFGCPSKDIITNKSGGYLLRTPKKIGEIINTVVSTVSCPVTAKIRSGYLKSNILTLGNIIEENGADAITLHARTVKQGFSGKASWAQIKILKKALTIPVIGNGDITKAQDAQRMINETNCDFVMIGRATMGYPYIFKECLNPNYQPSINERKNTIIKFINIYAKQKERSLSELKQHLMWMFKGMQNATKIREELSHIKEIKQLQTKIQNILSYL